MTAKVVTARFYGLSNLAIINELPIHDEARNSVIGCNRQLITDLQPIVDTCRDADTFLWAMQYAYSELLQDCGSGHEFRLGLLDLLGTGFCPQARSGRPSCTRTF
ncbi:MAG: hypothetical protein JO022_05530 [Acidobacteriaceae bacterium]|nr:hypothetical protein [Acidobacteriaceae bacterium]